MCSDGEVMQQQTKLKTTDTISFGEQLVFKLYIYLHLKCTLIPNDDNRKLYSVISFARWPRMYDITLKKLQK